VKAVILAGSLGTRISEAIYVHPKPMRLRSTTKPTVVFPVVNVATDLYDHARYRQRLGLAHKANSFAQIAAAPLHELPIQMDAGIGKRVYKS